MPLLSIGLPFYNNHTHLLDTIRSVLAQTYPDWELLLVDDGSTDQSLELAKSVRDPRIRLFSDGTNKGLAQRLNEIARHARGDICLRLDADDLMHPTRAARIAEYFQDRPDVDAVFSPAYMIDERNAVISYSGVVERKTVQEVLKYQFNCHPTLAMRTRWALKNPYPARTRRAEDMDLWCNCFSTTTFGEIPEPIYYCRLVSHYSLKTYASTVNDHCRVILSHGPALLGLVSTCGLLIEKQMKIVITCAARAIGLRPEATRRSLTPVEQSVKDIEERTIAFILAQQLPTRSAAAQTV